MVRRECNGLMNEFEKAVRKALIDKDMKLTDLADAIGISLTYLYDILSGNRKAEHQKKKIIEILELREDFD
jgi:predicted transcriptional regulator